MTLLAELQLGSFICLVLIMVVTLLVVSGLARHREPRGPGRPRIVPVQRPREPAASPEACETRLRELAGDLIERLESKATALDQLRRIADQRIARLEELLADEGTPRPAPATIPDEPATSQAAGLSRIDRPENDAADPGALRGPTRRPADPARHEQIYALADDGHAAEAIAARTGVPVGEVELILGLRRQG